MEHKFCTGKNVVCGNLSFNFFWEESEIIKKYVFVRLSV